MFLDESQKRSYDEMLQEAINNLKENTEIQNFSAGSIARALLEVYYDDLEEAHRLLSFSTAMRFVSSAQGPYLEEIAKLFNMEKRPGETDENFRYRIIHATEKYAKANEMSLRLAILSLEEVYDVEFKRFTRGTGSFDAYVITENPEDAQGILNAVQDIIDEDESFGVDGRVYQPELVYVDMDVTVIFHDNTSGDRIRSMMTDIEQNLREYLDNITFGESLVITQMISNIHNVSDNDIKDVVINNMHINGDQVTINNKKFHWDERVVADNIRIS